MSNQRIFTAVVLLGLAAGCGKAELFCDENTPCTNPDRPFCDLTGEFPESEGHGRTCIADPFDGGVPDCEASESVCENDVFVVCNAAGNIEKAEACPLGCHDTEVRCNKLDPSNGLAEHLDDAETEGPDIILGDGAIFDTDTGIVTNGDGSTVDIPTVLLPAPTDGVEVRVFKVGELTVGDATITGTRAAAIVAASDVSLQGSLLISPTAGQAPVALCSYPTFMPTTGALSGGGGGGFGGVGGNGGSANGAQAKPGGRAIGASELIPLRGGCKGTVVCAGPVLCSCSLGNCHSSFGGGALQLVSAARIGLGDSGFSGSVEAHGSGGAPGGSFNPGVGGGSGGAILLEAPIVEVVSGSLGANGGGGACGAIAGGSGTLAGSSNGAECSPPDGSGGTGATDNRTAANGAPSTTGAGGGGGGSVGRIRINAAMNGFVGGNSSPAPSVGLVGVR